MKDAVPSGSAASNKRGKSEGNAGRAGGGPLGRCNWGGGRFVDLNSSPIRRA